MIFVPRPYQKHIIAHIQSHDRCNVFASPGMGKTGGTLTALEAMTLVDDVWPALAIGPLRVANSVWSREVAKWAHLRGLRVSKILGTADERRAAMRVPADVYTIHYGLLTWLLKELDGKWPYRTVIPDESTRLKSQRCSWQRHKTTGKVFFRAGGAVNPAALARVAHKAKHWVNLTGTPAPNGLKDLWGQQWYVDFGASLGASYTAFTDRWFRQRRGTSNEQAVFEPLPHAHDEITRAIAPTSISLNAYDWFDVDKPREVVIDVDLDDRLMKQYRTLHEDAVLKLSEQTTITAVNAGVVTNKCLQFASGHLFDDKGKPHHLHDHKLDALDSLVENLNGAPLLVAYHFEPDREAILRRFKFAQLLPSGAKQQAVEDAWNEGRIPMLVVHPASAGHGLNLQYGGCDLAFYTPYWDLELREQIIERIGPVRQMQAGLNRVVSVYNLLARRTFDRAVLQCTTAKAVNQQAIMEAVRV